MAAEITSRRKSGTRWVYLFIAVVAVAGLGLYLFMPRLEVDRVPAAEAVCHANLRHIGMAIAMYMSEHRGAFPADAHKYAAHMLKTSPAPENPKLKCPLAPVANYIFVPENAGEGSTLPIAYEPISNHKKGAHVLFADMHVEFVRKAEYDEVTARRKDLASQPQ